MIEIEVRLFNSLQRYAADARGRIALQLPAPATLGDALARLPVPAERIFVAWVNGYSVKQGVGFDAALECERPLAAGDVVALSGPVPFSRGYGTPVC